MKFKGIKCPNCQKKGLHHPDLPHAFRWKDYEKAVCRFCHSKFLVQDKPEKLLTQNPKVVVK